MFSQQVDCLEVVQSIVDGFCAIRAYPGGKPKLKEWTDCVYKALRVMGESRGYEVYCSDGKKGYGEYLLDVVWFHPLTFHADVAVECEWKEGPDIAYDFEKLLWTKASLKMMICDPQRRNADALRDITAKAARYHYHLAGERYVLLQVNGTPTGGEARAFSWHVNSSGRHEHVSFAAIDRSFPYSLKPDDVEQFPDQSQ